MEPKDILNRANNPNHIPGIYNYCDRWCERCSFTARCLTREISKEHEEKIGEMDLQNEKFWNELSGIFADTFKLIQHVAKEKGIDLNNIPEEEIKAEMENQEKVRKTAKTHSIATSANDYMKQVDKFFKTEKQFLDENLEEMNKQIKLGINLDKIQKDSFNIADSFEIILWYRAQIYVKMMRALSDKFEGEQFFEENNFPKDSDGSAKVALIGIDRSLTAWGRLQQLLPEKADEIITFLFQLEKLRKHIEWYFPNARAFKRPGFDD